jgi:acyl carrier protein
MRTLKIISSVKEKILRFGAPGINVTDELTLSNAGIDSLERLEIEAELETEFQLPNPKTTMWLKATDDALTITKKIEQWKP